MCLKKKKNIFINSRCNYYFSLFLMKMTVRELKASKTNFAKIDFNCLKKWLQTLNK